MLPFLLLEMHLALLAAERRPLAAVVPEILGPLPSKPRPPRAYPFPRSNRTYYYEGQTVVRTVRGRTERAWDCAYLTGGHHPAHAKDDDPEQTYEIGNSTQTTMVISAGCVCLRVTAMSAEPVSPTQRDMGPGACTSPCPRTKASPAFDPTVAWCSTGAGGSTESCSLYGGVAEGPWRKLKKLQ